MPRVSPMDRFLNTERHPGKSIFIVPRPTEFKDRDTYSTFCKAIMANSNEDIAAKSVRTLEDILEDLADTRPRIPFLLVLIADVRWCLGARTTALEFYQEAFDISKDENLGQWLDGIRQFVINDALNDLEKYKNARTNIIRFGRGQQWRSTILHDREPPLVQLSPLAIHSFREGWAKLQAIPDVLDKYCNFHCVETNEMEGTVTFDASGTTRLVQLGFFNQAMPVITDHNIVRGEMRNSADALSVLQDTFKTLKIVFDFLEPTPLNLDIDVICRLHRTLMHTSRVVYCHTVDANNQAKFRYTHIGRTRQTVRSNAIAGPSDARIQFCPYDSVDSELSTFCVRFNDIIRRDDLDPFVVSAWIQHVFVTIHPFQDGNGRLSRILGSIPLVRARLPPLSITKQQRVSYIQALNAVRDSTNRGSAEAYLVLMRRLYTSSMMAMEELQFLLLQELHQD